MGVKKVIVTRRNCILLQVTYFCQAKLKNFKIGSKMSRRKRKFKPIDFGFTMDDLRKIIAARLKKAREEADGLTQDELCDMINVQRSTYAQYEIGRNSLPAETLVKVCKALNKSPSFFLGIGEPDMTPEEVELLAAYRSIDKPKREVILELIQGAARTKFDV